MTVVKGKSMGPKKTVKKKAASKAGTKKAAPVKGTKKAAAKKSVAKKSAPAKAAKKAAAKKSVAKKSAPVKATKKSAAKKTAVKKSAPAKATKKAVTKKAAVKKSAAKKSVKEKVVGKTVKKSTAKASPVKKPVGTLKTSAARQKKFQIIREKLLHQRQELLTEAESAMNALPEQTVFPDLGDQASAEADRNFMLRLRGREQRLLNKIEEAIEKIDTDNFGICDMCGEEIGAERLLVRPVASLCIDCKVEQEEDEKLQGG